MQILIAEDETRLAKNVAEALELEHYNTTVVHDGEAALDAATQHTFDLIILDIMMPKLDGLDVLDRLRGLGVQTPIMLLTALSTVENRVTGLDMGADDYLPKPFALEELLARVRALLRRPIETHGPTLEFNSLRLDTATATVSRAGQTVDLSATEYRLLRYLLENAGKVVKEIDIIDTVWDRNYDGVSNIVSVYIGYLRKKIDKAFPNETPIITTVRGLGYSIRIQ